MSQPDCLFCRLVANGDHVHTADGFVAIRDIQPAAETHLLVLPERHIDTFRQIDEFPDEEAGRMLRFVAAVAAAEGLDDYRVIVNVGPRGTDGVPSALARTGRKSASPGSTEAIEGRLCCGLIAHRKRAQAGAPRA